MELVGVKTCADVINVSGALRVSISRCIRRLESALRAEEADAHSLLIKPPWLGSEHPACSGLMPLWAVYVRSEMKNLFKVTSISASPLIPPAGGDVTGSWRQGLNHL